MMAEYIYKPDLEEHVMVRQEEIIRCRDCNNTFSVIDKLYCNRNHNLDGECYRVYDNGFCAWAERDA